MLTSPLRGRNGDNAKFGISSSAMCNYAAAPPSPSSSSSSERRGNIMSVLVTS